MYVTCQTDITGFHHVLKVNRDRTQTHHLQRDTKQIAGIRPSITKVYFGGSLLTKNIMDSRLLAFVSVCLFLLTSPVFSAPAADPKPHLEQSKDLPISKRPKYMDTREPQDIFKDLVFLTLQQLVSDGKVNPEAITDTDAGVPNKRGYQGLCLRRTANQRYIAYPCWRTGSK